MPPRVSKRARELLRTGIVPAGRRPGEPAKPPSPLHDERQYTRGLLVLLQPLQELTRRELLPALEVTLESDFAQDGPVQTIESIINNIRFRYGQQIKPGQVQGTVTRTTTSVNSKNKAYYSNTFNTLLGIDFTTFEPWLSGEVTAFTAENVALIRTIPEQALAQIEEIAIRSVREGARMSTVAKEIEERFSVARGRARVIARDQVSKLASSLNKQRQQAAGVTEYEWVDVDDNDVRPSHKARDGHTFNWNQAIQPQLAAKNLPIDPIDGHPGVPIQCRCFPKPVIPKLVSTSAI